jgi:NAD-dependent deacetylase
MDCHHGRKVLDYDGLQIPPECPQCGGIMRPEVVLFGEALPTRALERLEAVLAEGVDVVLSVGTSSVFPYIAGPVVWAAQSGIPTVEINPGDTPVSALVDHRLRMCAAEALPELWRRMRPRDPAED